MPEYTFKCEECESTFSVVIHMSEYDQKIKKKQIKCNSCHSKMITRDYRTDCMSISGSVKKSDTELRTVGDLADRNRDRMSNDQKHELHTKHNSYKETSSEKPLPAGMSRINVKERKKTIWPK
jgi:hypothetical protein